MTDPLGLLGLGMIAAIGAAIADEPGALFAVVLFG